MCLWHLLQQATPVVLQTLSVVFTRFFVVRLIIPLYKKEKKINRAQRDYITHRGKVPE